MIVIVVGEPAVLHMTASGSHVGFTSDDRFDAGVLGLAVELDRAEHIAVIGHGHGRLPERFDLLDERIDLICAVKQTVLGMEMEMDEWRCHGRILESEMDEVKHGNSRDSNRVGRCSWSARPLKADRQPADYPRARATRGLRRPSLDARSVGQSAACLKYAGML